jgi:hypothetical protein
MVAIEYFCIDLVCLGALLDAPGIVSGFFGTNDNGFDFVLLAIGNKCMRIDPCRLKDQTEVSLVL